MFLPDEYYQIIEISGNIQHPNFKGGVNLRGNQSDWLLMIFLSLKVVFHICKGALNRAVSILYCSGALTAEKFFVGDK